MVGIWADVIWETSTNMKWGKEICFHRIFEQKGSIHSFIYLTNKQTDRFRSWGYSYASRLVYLSYASWRDRKITKIYQQTRQFQIVTKCCEENKTGTGDRGQQVWRQRGSFRLGCPAKLSAEATFWNYSLLSATHHKGCSWMSGLAFTNVLLGFVHNSAPWRKSWCQSLGTESIRWVTHAYMEEKKKLLQ